MRAIVTGAASGIGAAVAARLADDGAEVTGIDLADCDGHVARAIRCDLTDPAARAALPLEGRYDVLVNAAGLPPRAGLEAAILSLNFMALRAVTEAILPRLGRGAAIVNVASKAGARWRENIAQVRRLIDLPEAADMAAFLAAERIDPVRAYDLSKEAVIVWTRAQTARLRPLGLRANVVSPAAVTTPILPDFEAAFGARAERGLALMGRPGRADEVAAVIAFLARPESGWLKGVDIPIDGGLAAIAESVEHGLIPEP